MKRKLLSIILFSTLVLSSLTFTGCTKKKVTDPTTVFEKQSDLLEDVLYVNKDGKYYPAFDWFTTSSSVSDTPNQDNLLIVQGILDKEDEDYIPTFYKGDKIFYKGSTIPDKINWVRYEDFGYTIGILNLLQNDYGNYFMSIKDGDSDNLCSNSSALDLLNLFGKDEDGSLVVQKIGKEVLDDDHVSKIGTILGLKKGKDYKVSVFKGTYESKYVLKADVRFFAEMEVYLNSEFKYITDNLIEIEIPENLQSGYYYIHDLGFLRYCAEEKDNEDIDYNEPIPLDQIIYTKSTMDETAELSPNVIKDNYPINDYLAWYDNLPSPESYEENKDKDNNKDETKKVKEIEEETTKEEKEKEK